MSIIITLLIVIAIIFALTPKTSNSQIVNPISYSTSVKKNIPDPAAPNCFSEQSFAAPVEMNIPAVEPAFDADAVQKAFEESNKTQNNQENIEADNKKVVLNDIDVTKTLEIKPQTEEVEACVCCEMPSIEALAGEDYTTDATLHISYEFDENEEELCNPSLDVNEPWFASYDITETTPKFEFAEIAF